jgi:hypothetical protein
MTKRQFCDLAYLRACSLPTSGFLSSDLASRTTKGTLFVEQQEVDEALAGFLEVLAERVDVLRLSAVTLGSRTMLAGPWHWRRSRQPAGFCFQQLVDLDAGGALPTDNG